MPASFSRLSQGMVKLEQALAPSRPAIQLGGVAATDPRFAAAAVRCGVRVLEPNHTAIACARAHRGITSMREAYRLKHEISLEAVLEVIRALRRAIPEEVFVLSAAPGTFDEKEPLFTREQAFSLAEAGADGLFIEKDNYREIERLTEIAHDGGMLVQAGFQLQRLDAPTALVPVRSPREARWAARYLEDLGVDIIAMRLSGIFQGALAGEVDPEELDCLHALVKEVKAATVVYAGVNTANLPTIAATRVAMVGIASAVDDGLYRALEEALARYASAAP